MPALQYVFKGITQLRFNLPALDSLCNDMKIYSSDINTLHTDINKIKPLNLKKHLVLSDINFSYPGTNFPVIDLLSVKIFANTSVAFVGETGSGKTTIADIILGLLRPDAGRIIVDGIVITDENIKNWQKNLGYIPQDIYLQDDTVTNNIAFGVNEKDIDMSAVIKASKIANIDSFIINDLPQGYNTIIGERGIRLSGGQRQRIGIARALYNDPEVLVLDEATSSLDGATEQSVFQEIRNIAGKKTLIMIAHRLTTVKDCDLIYVLKKGKVVGMGSFKELIISNKEFIRISKSH